MHHFPLTILVGFFFLKTGAKINLLSPVSGGVRNFEYRSFIELNMGFRNLLLHHSNGLLNSSVPHSKTFFLLEGIMSRYESRREVQKSL